MWIGEHAYPEDYPQEDQEILFTGVFKIGKANGFSYMYIETEALAIL